MLASELITVVAVFIIACTYISGEVLIKLQNSNEA